VPATHLPLALRLLARRFGSWTDVAPLALCLGDLVDAGLRPLAASQSARAQAVIDGWAPATRSPQL
jgi:hypothetical protein